MMAGNIYNEFQKVMAEMNKTDAQKILSQYKEITAEALPVMNKALQGMLKPPSKGLLGLTKKAYSDPKANTKMSEFVKNAQERNPAILTNLQQSWNPVSVFRHDPKNLRITYEVSTPSMQLLGDQMPKVTEEVLDATEDAITDNDTDFIGDLIRGVVHGQITKVTWEGGD